MIDNETVRKASEIGIIDVVDAIKLIETNPAYITLTFDEKKYGHRLCLSTKI